MFWGLATWNLHPQGKAMAFIRRLTPQPENKYTGPSVSILPPPDL